MSIDWTRRGEIMRLESPWVTVLAERWQDTCGAMLDYWRVQRADSAIVLPLQSDTLLFPTFAPASARARRIFQVGGLQLLFRPAAVGLRGPHRC